MSPIVAVASSGIANVLRSLKSFVAAGPSAAESSTETSVPIVVRRSSRRSDSRNLNQEIVRAGLAWWYQQYARRETVLPDLENEAREAKRGLWRDWRKAAAKARQR
jgi:endonuclease YncB( thermonuclease family)